MKKRWTTFDEAAAQYTAYTGKVPEESKMQVLYHQYRNEWKGFDGFRNWMEYHQEVVA